MLVSTQLFNNKMTLFSENLQNKTELFMLQIPQTLPETSQLSSTLPTDGVFRDEPSESFHELIDVCL